MMNFCMAFWTDGQENSSRVRNVKLTWQYLKDMVGYLNSKQIACSAQLFDFSPEKIINDATHIPYPLGVYKRAEKLNKILELLPHDENVSLVDCDVFVHKSHWDNLANILKRFDANSGYFFNFARLSETTQLESIDNITLEDAEYNLVFHRGYAGAFGGLFLCSVDAIIKSGGYDAERYTAWGGEDGDLMVRFQANNFRNIQISEDEVLPLHLPHFADRSNILYFNGEEYANNLRG